MFCLVMFFPKCHQIITSTLFGLIVSWFWSKYLFWICCVLIFWCLLFFILSSYLCLDLHKFLFINSIVFIFWSLAVFFQFLQNPLFYITLCWLFCLKKLFPYIGNFWFSGLCKIEVLQKRQKKNQLKRVNRKRMINILKIVCKYGHYSWRNWTLNLKNLLKKNGSCVWSETNARI